MGRGIPPEKQARILRLHAEGKSHHQIALMATCNWATVQKVVDRGYVLEPPPPNAEREKPGPPTWRCPFCGALLVEPPPCLACRITGQWRWEAYWIRKKARKA